MDFWKEKGRFPLKKYVAWNKNTCKFLFFLLPTFVRLFSGQKTQILKYRKTELMIFYTIV